MTPSNPASEPNSHILAQRISNRVLLDLISHYGKQLLTGSFTNPTKSPFPTANFETPRDPRNLLSRCKP
jgi:adenosylhomocysteine nucleosidase